MKTTKIMLAVLSTFITTWLILGLLIYLLSTDVTYKQVLITPGLLMFMFALGWIPSVIVANDLDDHLSA